MRSPSGRRVRIREFDDSDPPVETSSKYFLWGGLSIAEERDGDDPETVKRLYFAQGEVRLNETLERHFYGRDHLGSVREVIYDGGAVMARYDYDPYGRREQTEGSLQFDWGFTGHYYHAKSGLHLAPFRAYSAELGRWLSRDPIGEDGGINLYEYALSNPVNYVDLLGLDVWDYIAPEWLINQGTADFAAGLGDALSLGLTDWVRDQFGWNCVTKDSTAYAAGGWVGFGAQMATTGGIGAVGVVAGKALLKGGVKKLVKNRARAFTRFFYDSRDFKRQISREYWKRRGPANGRSLHHWAIPQRAKWVPEGIRNAGWNLLELPAMRGVFHRNLGLNQWMGLARQWGPGARLGAAAMENAIRLGIPLSAAGSAYTGYRVAR
jgi:RHS repeat-associated protein